MGERAIAAAFEANEIKKIITDELAKRLDGLSPLTGGKEYSRFAASFQVNITLFRAGEPGLGRKTVAWGNAKSHSGLSSTEPAEIGAMRCCGRSGWRMMSSPSTRKSPPC
jgi:hypothetical protein